MQDTKISGVDGRRRGLKWLLFALAIVAVAGAFLFLRFKDPNAVSVPKGSSSQDSANNQWLPTARFALAQAQQGGSASVSLTDIAERATKSVVSVSSTKRVDMQGQEGQLFDNPLFRHFFGPWQEIPRERLERGLGSGVIVSKDGVILTNSHVVEQADEIMVVLPGGREVKAEVVGTDPKTDLAVIKLEKKVQDLIPLEMGDSKRLRLGDIVLAIGNPFGVGQTVTMGIVSGLSRTGMGIVDYEDFIQTDAAINPGNSGGALVSMDAKLVGINTAILSRTGGYQGIGFAIPTSMVTPVMDSLLEHGKVIRGWLGVGIQDINEDLQQALGLKTKEGVLISDVVADGPAAKAGIQRGDVIVELDGKPVTGTTEFRNKIAATSPGTKTTLTVIRDNDRKKLTVTLGTMPAQQKAGTEREQGLGLRLAPLTPAVRSQLQIPGNIQNGVVIAEIVPGSPAASAGLQPADVILEANRTAVKSPQQFKQIVDAAKGPIALLVFRDGNTVYLTLKPAGGD